MEFWRNITGTLTVKLVSADLYGTMTALEEADIAIWDVEWISQLELHCKLHAKDWKKLRRMLHNRAEEVRILARNGLIQRLLPLRKRPVLVVGMLLLLLFTLWVPGRIFFVQVDGNSQTPTRQILEAAAKCGIAFGASRRDVRSEKMKNALLEAMPTLSWAGVNTNGCTAVISVRERAWEQKETENTTVSSIVAVCDGVIREMTVLRGSAVCSIGQAVKKGQILISGYTDCGICVQADQAAGEIYAETKRSIRLLTPNIFTLRGELFGKTEKISLIIGKNRIIFSNSSGISGTTCAKIYEEKYITLPGGFVLPIAIVKETWMVYETHGETLAVSQEDLGQYAKDYLIDHMCSGMVLAAAEVTNTIDDATHLLGNYHCYEMIGATKIEENMIDVENYGKNG